jgi:hypothetical protein
MAMEISSEDLYERLWVMRADRPVRGTTGVPFDAMPFGINSRIAVYQK